MAIRMELSRILIRELNDYQIIELREVLQDGESHEARSFPIVIGRPEAEAIERRLKGIPVQRPQTHDLLAHIINELGGTLKSITINDLSDHTFFASLNIARPNGEMLNVDSRPSDAIALGIAGNVPIFVEEHVLAGALADESES